jgi:putative endonuclease
MTLLLGAAGETKVVDYLLENGFTIIERNYRVREGEIDIVAQKKELLIFVEVKTRAASTYALSEVITRSKQKKIIFTAKHFLVTHHYKNHVYRFDIALVQGAGLTITYIPNAFSETNW